MATIYVYDSQGDPQANPFDRDNLAVFAGAADMGLVAGDAIDALVLSDVTPGGGTPTPNGLMDIGDDEVLFSLSTGSPTLTAVGGSGADLFYSTFDGTFVRQVSADELGLLSTDDVDAADIGRTFDIFDCN